MLGHTARTYALLLGAAREQYWYEKIDDLVGGLGASRGSRHFVNALLFARGVPEYLPLSNAHVRHASRVAFVDTLAAQWQQHPSQRLYLATFAGLRGVTTLARPAINLVVFQRAIDAALRHRNLSGVFSFEFDIVRTAGGIDNPVLFHAHGIIRYDGPGKFQFKRTRADLRASPAFPGWDGAVGAHLKPICRTEQDLLTVANYLADPVHQLKRLQPHPKIEGRRRLRATRTGFTAALALRGTQLQSLLSIRDTVLGVGAFGAELRRGWWQRLQANLPRQAAQGPVIERALVNTLWQSINAQRPSLAGYGNIRIATRSRACGA